MSEPVDQWGLPPIRWTDGQVFLRYKEPTEDVLIVLRDLIAGLTVIDRHSDSLLYVAGETPTAIGPLDCVFATLRSILLRSFRVNVAEACGMDPLSFDYLACSSELLPGGLMLLTRYWKPNQGNAYAANAVVRAGDDEYALWYYD